MRTSAIHLRDIPILVHTLWLLARLAVLRHVLPLPDLVQRFDSRSTSGTTDGVDVVHIDRLVWLTRSLLRRIYGEHFCMQQTLILFYFFRRHDYPARIHIGVTRQGGKLVGHAWLDLNGRPLAEVRDPNLSYETTFSYPSH